MDLTNISYSELLKHIDTLRDSGMGDTHPDMIKAKWKLRDFLHNQKKSQKVVPKLKSVKTLALVEKTNPENYRKLGALAAILVIGVYLLKRRNS